MRHRVCFRRWPLSLQNARNEIKVLRGGGWYTQRERNVEGDLWYGDDPCLWFELRWTEENRPRAFVSGPDLLFCPSPVVRNNIYFGETQDLRLPPPGKGAVTRPVSLCGGPEGQMELQRCPADRVIRSFAPTLLSRRDGRRIYDAGHNITGWAALTVGGGSGDTVTARYAETLDENGNLDFASCGKNQVQTDQYISGGLPARCHPHFTWHGFRYVEISGPAADVEIEQVHAAVDVTGSFSCSEPILNRLYDAYARTRLNNMHCGVPTDCPHRERLGYTGDGQATAMTDMYLLDGDLFYRKWIQDILDCQDPVTGHVQQTAPFYGGGGGPGGWGCAIVAVPYQYWKFYGDTSVLREYYPHMKKYLDYMEAHCDDHLVVREEPQGWCLGDWCTPRQDKRGVPIPEPFVNTYFYIRSLRQVMEIAPLVGKAGDLPALRQREEAAACALTNRYFDPATGSFCGEVCGADAFALDLGLGDARTLQNLVMHYREIKVFDTGIFGTPLVVKALFENGFANDAVQLLANRGEVSFCHMMQSGATTLWEEWFNEDSSSHPMFGAVVEYLFKYILGIRQKENSVGFSDVTIEPCPASVLDWAEGSVVLGGKRISVRVENGKAVLLNITQI
jgi:alpha-L-rhamnosidase